MKKINLKTFGLHFALGKILTRRERIVYTLRLQGKPLEHVGRELMVTRERIRQIEGKINIKMDKCFNISINENEVNKVLVENFLNESLENLNISGIGDTSLKRLRRERIYTVKDVLRVGINGLNIVLPSNRSDILMGKIIKNMDTKSYSSWLDRLS